MPYCRSENFIVLIYCFGFGAAALSNWSEYESCYAPTQVFVIEALSLILLHRGCELLKSKSFMPTILKKILAIFINLILHPAFLYLTVQGLIWQIMNINQEPNCIFIEQRSWLVWMMIAVLLIIDIAIIHYSVKSFIIWTKLRAMRRRQALDEAQIMEEYINYRLNQMFLAGALFDDSEDTRNLSSDDLLKLKRRTYDGTTNDSRQTGDSCPVCYEDFKMGEEICTLPGCSHLFHWKCIHNWLSMNPLCPMCRTNVKQSLLEIELSTSQNDTLCQPDIEAQLLARN